MTQLDFPLAPRARGSDPETSHEAAKRVIDFAHGHYALILGSLKVSGPGTIYHLAERTGLTHVQVARRNAELHDAGWIEPTGVNEASPSGRPCRVWRLVSLPNAERLAA